MAAHPSAWLLVGLLVAFALFLLLRSSGMLLLAASRKRHPAWQRLAQARHAARQQRHTPSQAAESWRRAAVIALEELQRPDLAASFAQRAAKVEPRQPNTWQLLSRALHTASRYRELEKLIWQQLADHAAPDSPASQQAFGELLALYDGPLRRPERAAVLRLLLKSTADHGAVTSARTSTGTSTANETGNPSTKHKE